MPLELLFLDFTSEIILVGHLPLILKSLWFYCLEFLDLLNGVVESLSCVWLFASPWTAACQVSMCLEGRVLCHLKKWTALWSNKLGIARICAGFMECYYLLGFCEPHSTLSALTILTLNIPKYWFSKLRKYIHLVCWAMMIVWHDFDSWVCWSFWLTLQRSTSAKQGP